MEENLIVDENNIVDEINALIKEFKDKAEKISEDIVSLKDLRVRIEALNKLL